MQNLCIYLMKPIDNIHTNSSDVQFIQYTTMHYYIS